MTQLNEGLKENDLADLVLPLISVDEYESKIDDDAIVIGFYVQDNDPAQDLNRFIQKSAVNLLDTDVSPAPNEDGYFLVFVELMRDSALPGKIMDILESLEGLTAIRANQWKFKPYGHTDMFDANRETLRDQVDLQPNSEDDEDELGDLGEFFKPSLLDDMQILGESITLHRRGYQRTMQLLAFGDPTMVYEGLHLLGAPVRLDEGSRLSTSQLRFYLGEGWTVDMVGDVAILSHTDQKKVAAVRL